MSLRSRLLREIGKDDVIGGQAQQGWYSLRDILDQHPDWDDDQVLSEATRSVGMHRDLAGRFRHDADQQGDFAIRLATAIAAATKTGGSVGWTGQR